MSEQMDKAIDGAMGYSRPVCSVNEVDHGPHNCGVCYQVWAWDNAKDVIHDALPHLEKHFAEVMARRLEAKSEYTAARFLRESDR